MIDQLHAENVALIKDATIEPAAGLTVLTGETGAGKTALLSALKLLVGERGDTGAIREGADGLVVEGRFFTATSDDEGTVIRRTVDASGRGRVSIDGHMASVRELAEGVGASVDLCGQHEHQRLLRPQTHVELLDGWIGDEARDALATYREALKASDAAADNLRRTRELARHADEQLDEAAFVLERIESVNPSVDELRELENDLPRAEHADALLRAVSSARAALLDDGGALDRLGDAATTLEAASAYDEGLERHARTLRSSIIDLEDLANDLRTYADGLEVDPTTLDAMQGRMAALQGLMRSYGPRIEDVLARRDRAAKLVRAARDGGEAIHAAQRAYDEAEDALARAATRLGGLRADRAPALAAAITSEMSNLAMGTAEVDLAVRELPRAQWTQAGPTSVELAYRPAAGMAAKPLRRIASGGEMSRVMLACKVVLGAGDAASTLVFDEVDAGVGGATAVALGNVLARLARTHQLIVVTHLAQIAVLAERHYVVRKHGADAPGAIPETTIDEVGGDDRVDEIARMLSGDTSDTSREHARAMLVKARAS